MMEVLHLMVPGLGARDLDALSPTARARLVGSFPATPHVQEQTLLCGVPPRLHGVLVPGDEPRTPGLIGRWHRRIDVLLEGGHRDDLLAEIGRQVAGADVVLVSGCPADAPGRTIDPVPVTPDGFRMVIDDCFALCSAHGGADLPREVMDEWLDTPGIERVLAPVATSAGSWMAPADRGWILVAEPGWCFRGVERAFGRFDAEGTLLCLGAEWPCAWPPAVHDWRIAPTVLALAGHDHAGCFDAPLEGADRLRG